MVPPFLPGRILTRASTGALLRNCAREIGAVRGAQNAGRHAGERIRRGPLARPNDAGTLAGDVTERAPERAEAFPAGVERDVCHRQVGIAQQRGRPLDAPSEEIAMRRDAERLLERSREVRLRHAAHAREAAHRPFLVARGIHAVLRAEQAAQEARVLSRMTCTHVGHCTQRVELRLCQSISAGGGSRVARSRGVVLRPPCDRYTRSTSRKKKSKEHARRDS